MVTETTLDARACFDAASNQFRARDIEAAIRSLNQAEREGYPADECAAARWECWMLLGQFERAWEESDAIAQRGSPDPHQFWDGKSFHGKRVIIRCLHGLGDTIQFIRYAPIIRREAQRVIVECHPEMVRLIERVDGIDEVITWGQGRPLAMPEWDSQIEVNELPRIFRTVEQTIPNTFPYVHVQGRSAALIPFDRIGLVWNSSQWNPSRSIPLMPLLESLTGVKSKLYNLQFGCETPQIPAFKPADGDVLTAAMNMMSLDLIITVDTMTAHLAGALGRPVWVLLPFECDWRWMLNRPDSPWYPTMRLFRQHVQGDWSGVLDEVRHAALSFGR